MTKWPPYEEKHERVELMVKATQPPPYDVNAKWRAATLIVSAVLQRQGSLRRTDFAPPPTELK